VKENQLLITVYETTLSELRTPSIPLSQITSDFERKVGAVPAEAQAFYKFYGSLGQAPLPQLQEYVHRRTLSDQRPLLNAMHYWKIFPKQIKKWLIYTRTPIVRLHFKNSFTFLPNFACCARVSILTLEFGNQRTPERSNSPNQ